MRRTLMAVAAGALAVSGCAGGVGDGDEGPDGNGSAESQSQAAALEPLQGPALDGSPFETASVEGRGVVLWFWAPWCTICRSEAPEVSKVAEELGDEVTFLGIPGLGSRDEMQGFVADTGVGALTHLPDEQGDLWSAYGVTSQPAWVFITPSGKASAFSGALGYEKLKNLAETATLDDS